MTKESSNRLRTSARLSPAHSTLVPRTGASAQSPANSNGVMKNYVIPSRQVGKAIHFLRFRTPEGSAPGANDPLELTKEGTEFLMSLEGPLSVIITVGNARGGKSFFINYTLLDLPASKPAFKVGTTIKSETRGLWIYDQPVTYVRPDGQKVKVIVLDSEGLGATTANATSDTKLLSMAVLISSVLFYNISGAINESHINSLSLAANVGEKIRVTASSQNLSSQEPEEGKKRAEQEAEENRKALGEKHFPKFVLLIRDFGLELQFEDGRPMTENQYMEHALAETSDSVEDGGKNETRRRLKQLFPKRECFTMVRPLNDEKDFQILGQGGDPEIDGKIRPQFREARRRVQEWISLNAPFKKALDSGVNVSGRMLLELTQTYLKAINQPNGVPVIKDSWAMLREVQIRDLTDQVWRTAVSITSKPAFVASVQGNGPNPLRPDQVDSVMGQVRIEVLAKLESLFAEELGASTEDFLNDPSLSEAKKKICVQLDEQTATVKALVEDRMRHWVEELSEFTLRKFTEEPVLPFEELRALILDQFQKLAAKVGRMQDSAFSSTMWTEFRSKVTEERILQALRKAHDLELDVVKSKAHEATKEFEIASQKLVDALNDAKEANEKYERLEAKENDLEHSRDKAMEELALERASFEEFKSQFQTLSSEHAREKEMHETMSTQWSQRLMELEEKVQNEGKGSMEKELEIQQLTDTVQKLKQEIQEREEEIVSLHKRLSGIEELTRKCDELESLYGNTKERLDSAQLQVREHKKTIDSFRAEQMEINARIEAAERERKLEIQDFQNQLENASRIKDEALREAENQKRDLLEKRAEAERQAERLAEQQQRDRAIQEREQASLKLQLDTISARMRKAEEDWSARHTKALEERDAKIREQGELLSQRQTHILNTQVEHSRDIEKLTAKNNMTLAMLESQKRLNEELGEEVRQSKRLRIDNEKLKIELESKNRAYERLLEDKANIEAECRKLDKNNMELQMRNTELERAQIRESMDLTKKRAHGIMSSSSMSDK